MQKNRKQAGRSLAGRRILLGTATLAGFVAQALAQQAADTREVVTVTGFRASVESSTRDKREATGFQDSIYAEDLGKFPDSNIAESLNRIPGVLISREITGEGLNIQIRGLGTSFTKILLNGAPVAVASTGRTDNQNTNREVDLDMLPTDLFTKLTVYKSPTADMIEGGAAGVVDMRTARPFDRPGQNIVMSLQGVENTVND
jgi:TonB-dependent receptor